VPLCIACKSDIKTEIRGVRNRRRRGGGGGGGEVINKGRFDRERKREET
jgi:hypothetical protein